MLGDDRECCPGKVYPAVEYPGNHWSDERSSLIWCALEINSRSGPRFDPQSGKIDMVTVNAIEAFQHRAGLKEDGLLNEETLRKLEEAAKNAPPPGAPPNPSG